MSQKNKTRLEVQKILIDSLNDCIEAFDLSGWKVMEFANPSIQSADKIILVNQIRSERVGWQGRKYGDNSQSEFSRTDEFIEEQSWQIHVIAKRKRPMTSADMLAEDMATILISWLNGFGVDGLVEKGVAPLRIDASNIIVYNDNSDLYQKRAVFTVKLQVPKEVTLKQKPLEFDKIEIHGV